MDALAWSYFKAGRLEDASRAASPATRTGTRDLRIVAHAAAIQLARGDEEAARALLRRIPADVLELEPIPWMEHRRVVSSLTQTVQRTTGS